MVIKKTGKILGKAKRALLKYIGVKSRIEYIASKLGEFTSYITNRYLDAKQWAKMRLIERLEQISKLIKEIDWWQYVEELKERARILADYLETAREYREMIGEFFRFIKKPELIDDSRLLPLKLIRDLMDMAIKWKRLAEDNPLKDWYKKLVDILVQWCKKIISDEELPPGDVDKIRNIPLDDANRIYDYAKFLPGIFKQSKISVEIFTEMVFIISKGYALLYMRERTTYEIDNIVYVKNAEIIAEFVYEDDIKAIEDMSKNLLENAKLHYIPAIIVDPSEILKMDPEYISLIIEYTENFISKGKKTRYQTIDTYTPDRWNEFIDRLSVIKETFENTGDIELAVMSAFPDIAKGISISNLLVGIKRGKKEKTGGN